MNLSRILKNYFLVCALTFAIQFHARAESQPEKKITFSGIADVYYLYNFNEPPSTSLNPGNNALRYFDLYHNQFGLNLAELSINAKLADASLTMDLDYGVTADYTHGASGTTTADEVNKHIGQLYINYNPSSLPRLHFVAGKMATHVGYEVTKARDNWQYSRSITYAYGMPFWHIGFGVGYDIVPEKLTSTVYLFNGWGFSSITDNNSGKTIGAQVKFTPRSDFTAVYNMVAGPEQAGTASNYRHVHEANFVYSPIENLSFALDGLVGWESGTTAGVATWQGVTLAAKWQACPRYTVSPRFEFFRDPDGFTIANGYSATAASGPSEKYFGVTLTNIVSLTEGLNAKAEFRYDRSNIATRFAKDTGTSKNQTTVLAALIYSF